MSTKDAWLSDIIMGAWQMYKEDRCSKLDFRSVVLYYWSI